MYRVLLGHDKKALAVECTEEELTVNTDGFVEAIRELVDNGDIIIFCNDLGKLQIAIDDPYKVEYL